MKITTAVFMLTPRCNMNCGFCCNNPETEKEMSTAYVKNGITQLKKEYPDVNRVVFTGGEPFLRNDLKELCLHARENNYRTRIHTNGTLMPRNVDFVDEINLPLDGSTKEVHDSIRREGHYNVIIGLLSKLEKPITITTVFCKQNKHDMQNLADTLEEYKPISWKIFKCAPTGRGKNNYEMYAVSDEDFENLKIHTKIRTYLIEDIKKSETYYMYVKN